MTRDAVTMFVIVIVSLFILTAGCTSPANSPAASPAAPGLPVPATPAPLSPAPASPATPAAASTPVTTVSPDPVITSRPVIVRIAGEQSPVPAVITYTQFSDANFSVEYPAGWKLSVREQPLREAFVNLPSCLATTSSLFTERLITVESPDRTSALYAWTVDRGNFPVPVINSTEYRAYINMIVDNESLCGVPVKGNVVIAGSSPKSYGPGSLSSQRVDFSILSTDTGTRLGTGTAEFVQGLHHNGIFILYATGDTNDLSRPVIDRIFNSLRPGAGF